MPKFNIKLLSEETAPTPAQEEQFFVNIDPIDNDSKTSEIYEARKKYKEQVNDKNLPIGNKAEYSRAIRKQTKKLKELQEEYNDLLQFFVQYPKPKELAEKENLTEAEAESFFSAQIDRADNLKRKKNKIPDEFEGIIPDLEASIENLKGKSEKGLSLRNQLDTWYENPSYGRIDYLGRAILSTPNRLIKIPNTNFLLQDFVAMATTNFLKQYNDERPTHPDSKLNNLKIKRAYSPILSYEEHLDKIYTRFFNDVLDEIKNTDKIKNVEQFSNLFYSWFIEQESPISSVGFFKETAANIYNTGLAFDFFTLRGERDKEKILNDVRFPVLNYVAKINGLRIDPNYPARLIADVGSIEMLNYAKTLKDFKEVSLNDIPKKIFSFSQAFPHFKSINFFKPEVSLDSGFGLKNTRIYSLISALNVIYNKFIIKYPFYVNYSRAEEYKKKFETSKIPREIANDNTFLDQKIVGGGNVDIKPFFIELYVKIRAKEEDVALSSAEIKYLRKQMTILSSSAKIPSFAKKQPSNFLLEQIWSTVNQPINYLELYLRTKKSNPDMTEKKNFIFSWGRAAT